DGLGHRAREMGCARESHERWMLRELRDGTRGEAPVTEPRGHRRSEDDDRAQARLTRGEPLVIVGHALCACNAHVCGRKLPRAQSFAPHLEVIGAEAFALEDVRGT